MRKINRKVGRSVRMIWILFASFVLQKPLLRVGKFFSGRFDYIFFVYPGTKNDMRGVVPQWFCANKKFRTKIFLGGIVTSSKNYSVGRGIVVGAPNTVENMITSREECLILKKELEKIATSFGVKAIAIAGRGPSIFVRHGIRLNEPFVYGRKGMIFCTIETILTVTKKHSISLNKQKIAIFGGGYVGKSIAKFLTDLNCCVSIVTARSIATYEKSAQVGNKDIDVLSQADIIVVISARGSDIYPYMQYFKDGAIVIDDAHPRMTRKFKRGFTYRAALTMDEAEFVPGLPVYGKKSIPGCVVEAIVTSQFGQITDQVIFNEKARDLGFKFYEE